jgi:Cu/Ag efflux protein CusF
MVLFGVLAAGILTMWVPARWALSGFQVAILALGVARLARGGARIPAGSLALAAVAGWGALQWALGTTVDAFRTQEEILHWLVCAVAFGLAAQVAPGERERVLTALVAFGAVLSCLGILTALSSPEGVVFWTFDAGTRGRTLGPFLYRNQWAAFAEVALAVALWRAFDPRAGGWAYAGAAGMLAASVVAAGSRMGVLLCSFELVAVPWLVARARGLRLRRLWPAATGLLAAVSLLTLAAGGRELWRRFEESNPYGLRKELLLSTLAMVRARPLTGFGLGAWPVAYPGFARFDDGTFVNQAHNDWAQWAAEGGVPLFLLLLGFAAALIRPAIMTVWGVGLVAVWVHAALDYPFQQRPALAVFWFAIGGLVASARGEFRYAQSVRVFAVLLVSLLLCACSRSGPVVDETLKRAEQEAERRYELRGEVKRLSPQDQIATIAHEQIGDWMGPMTMEFPVPQAADFAKLREGQPVRAKVYVQGVRFWLAEVEDPPAK